ncbi:hypothetical protein BDZ89DRAFT_1066876 [Hymenopellis radicata]|nr:hypothetical protein BDZ89DRAFT_1066876 [Hymenopellis radicata]
MSMDPPPAPKPFDSSDRADHVIITSDGTILYVVKALLIYASPFFANLLGDSSPDETYENLPVYRSSEDCRTMCAVLRLCYPVDTAPSEISVDVAVLEALQKYMMEDAQERWKKTIVFLDLAKTQPLRIFAIACRCRWSDIARAAAKAVLSIPLRNWQTSEELRNITGMDYHVLVRYYTQCSDAVEEAFSSPDGAKLAIPLRSSDDVTILASSMKKSSDRAYLFCCCQDGSNKGPALSSAHVPSWVHRLVENARDRSGSCPGRAVQCDESLVVAALDAGKNSRDPVQASDVLKVCKMIDNGVQAAINKVDIELAF